ncbi:hypothetical protein BH23ACT5_BH23ACT5_20870 [soil metagenome]
MAVTARHPQADSPVLVHVSALSPPRLALACSVLLVLVSVLVASPADGAEAPPAAAPWLDEDFSGGVSGVFDSGFGVHPTSDGHVGAGLVSRIPQGQHWGSSAHWTTKTQVGFEPDAMWLRYYVRFPTGFEVADGNRGKLPGFGGLYTYNCLGGRASTTSSPCWSARMMFSPLYDNDGLPSYPVDRDAVTRIGFYAYTLSSSGQGQSGNVIPWDADVATLRHDRWYCIEARVEMNTPGEPDGVLEGFVDGLNAYSSSSLMFRRASEGNLAVKSLWFDVYHGGDATSPRDNSIFFDSLAAGPDRIGCDDNPDSRGTFHDDDDSVFEADIERLAAAGVTRGCNPPANTRFCPDDPVTRGQMAAFLHRALDDRLDVHVDPIPDSPPDFWGVRSSMRYTDALAAFTTAEAPLDTYVVTYPVDDVSGDKDWLATGNDDNPNKWVPAQLGKIWEAGATPYVQVTVSDLPKLANGGFDPRLRNMFTAFDSFLGANPGSRLIVDVLPGANRQQVAYGDDPGGFRTAFRHVAAMADDRLGPERVRMAFSAHRQLSSDRYGTTVQDPGAFSRWWPGGDVVDLAGIRGTVSSATANPVAVFETALDAMATVAGADTPLFVGLAGAPDEPTLAAQSEFLGKLANWASEHPQIAGVLWDDVVTGGQDFRLTFPSLPPDIASRTAPIRTDGAAWLFSFVAKNWADARQSVAPFGDAESSVFAESIRWLSASGITKGCNPPANTSFCPDASVTRGQMAAFMARALDLASGSEAFSDTAGHVFAADISRLASAGITKGCNPPSNTRFCPDDPVTRGQMAAFMVRAGLTD